MFHAHFYVQGFTCVLILLLFSIYLMIRIKYFRVSYYYFFNQICEYIKKVIAKRLLFTMITSPPTLHPPTLHPLPEPQPHAHTPAPKQAIICGPQFFMLNFE